MEPTQGITWGQGHCSVHEQATAMHPHMAGRSRRGQLEYDPPLVVGTGFHCSLNFQQNTKETTSRVESLGKGKIQGAVLEPEPAQNLGSGLSQSPGAQEAGKFKRETKDPWPGESEPAWNISNKNPLITRARKRKPVGERQKEREKESQAWERPESDGRWDQE